jgi:SynChlorMet cassette radical SAM/SPASM protein ScmE
VEKGGVLRKEWETYAADLKIPRAPLSLFISITSRCNLACRHCAVYADDLAYGADLSTDQWLSFIDQIESLKIFRVKISGGEPFVRPDIFEILDHLSCMPIRFSINTNAALIDEPAARRLASYGARLSDVMVSIDGASGKTHDALRGAGAFYDMVAGAAHLVRHVKRISAYCTVTRLNFRELSDVVRLASEIGIASVKFNDLILMGRGLKYRDELALSIDEERETTALLKTLKAAHPSISGTFLERDDIFDRIRSVTAEELSGWSAAQNSLSGCGALTKECAIRPDGWATPCDRLPELVAENVLEKPLEAIWRESEVFTEFRRRFFTPIRSLITCADCRYAPLCTGGCAASAYSAYGTTLARDPSCCYRLYEEETAHGPG